MRHRATRLALFATVGLTVFKLAVAWMSGSVGVLSEGLHSFLDLISATVAFYTVRQSIKPADEDHPFGHGKFETISSLFEGILLIGAAIIIGIEGLEHFRNPHPIEHEGLATATIFISMVVSFWVYLNNSKAGKAAESLAIQANALHFLTDVIASLGVLVSLIIMQITHWWIMDPIAAFAVAAYIGVITYYQLKTVLGELSDSQLPPEEIEQIKKVFEEFKGQILDAHDLRTRKSGAFRHIDFHLHVCGVMSVKDSHDVCDRIEARLVEVFPRASVTIHVEPCEQIRPKCNEKCDFFCELPVHLGKIPSSKEG